MLPPEYQGRAGGSDLSRMPLLQDTARLWRQCEHIAGRLALEVDIRRNGLHLLELRDRDHVARNRMLPAGR